MRNVMTRAWEIAKEGKELFGGKASEYLSESLKLAWKEEKTEEVLEIKEWFLNKNFSYNEVFAIQTADFTILKQTEKAYFLKAHTDFGNITFWAPKSVCLNRQQFNLKNQKREEAMQRGLERNLKLLEEAKALGIKGVRKGMKTKTLERKIAEHKAA